MTKNTLEYVFSRVEKTLTGGKEISFALQMIFLASGQGGGQIIHNLYYKKWNKFCHHNIK